MSRQIKAPRTPVAPSDDIRNAEERTLSDMLADALSRTPIGQEHGALEAIQTALAELKHRVASVSPHLNKQRCADIIERIQSL